MQRGMLDAYHVVRAGPVMWDSGLMQCPHPPKVVGVPSPPIPTKPLPSWFAAVGPALPGRVAGRPLRRGATPTVDFAPASLGHRFGSDPTPQRQADRYARPERAGSAKEAALMQD